MITPSNAIVRLFLTFIFVSALTACGGGGGGDSPNKANSSSLSFSIASEGAVTSSSALSSELASFSLSSSSSLPSSSSLSSSSSASSVRVTSVIISAPKTELIVGEEVELSVTTYYSDGHSIPDGDAWWWYGNSGVISIKGRTLTAEAVGEIWLIADSAGPNWQVNTNRLYFTVKEDPNSLLDLHLGLTESAPVVVGSTGRMQLVGDYLNGESLVIKNTKVAFVSANPQVVAIWEGGFFDARTAGKTTITATYSGKSVTYEIEVLASGALPPVNSSVSSLSSSFSSSFSNSSSISSSSSLSSFSSAQSSVKPEGAVFHILKPASWNSTLNAHWFSPKVQGVVAEKLSTFPGSAMQDLDGDGWYDITLNGLEEFNILFNDGGSFADGFHQTADLIARKGGWLVLDEFANPAGKYYGTWYDSKPDLVKQDICDVKTFGAKGDGISKDTLAIQKAIDACAGKNGIVRLREGKFVSGTIVLKSAMTLRIEPSATLLGTRDAADYPDQPKLSGNSQYLNCRKALIYAEKANNIRIDGGGTIDGNGGNGSPWMTGLEATRPMAIFLVQSDGITLQNITVKNSAMWTVVPFESSNITIRGVTVNSQVGHNLDGIDIVDGHHVLIESVEITSQDDAICLKSGLRERGVVDVMVRYSKVNKSTVANGLKFGTATSGPFRDITFDNISLNNVTRGGIAVESVDGSAVSNIVYRNITMDNVGTPFYMVLGYRSKDANAVQRVGSIDNVTFENIVATRTAKTWGSYISGVVIKGETFRLTNLLFKNIDINFLGGSTNIGTPWEYNATYTGEYPDPGPSTNTGNKQDMPGYMYFRHADNVRLINAKLSVSPSDARPLTVTEDVNNFSNDNP